MRQEKQAKSKDAKRGGKGSGGGDDNGPFGRGAELLLTSERLAFERLMRVVLALPSRPAVILLEAFSFTHAKDLMSGFATLPQDTHSVGNRVWMHSQAS
jgi:hypothetical protein